MSMKLCSLLSVENADF